ncbi:MAG TPA: hypothetical protein VKA90_03250 [Beijerinckiaceae bacterium]|nr:hypothetical protein [Beijerinckiaceae bacterium]
MDEIGEPATSFSGCPAVKARLRRAVPSGTVGGRIATTQNPSPSKKREASSAA